jgi:flavin reductase (DIM6/NTAB) family NADH-FMN oxidoreductase RutF
MDPLYLMLRNLTSPVVAITTSADGRRNGQIVNSAQRASLVPTVPRVSMYISKINLTHDLIWRSGVFGMHLLRTDQWDLIWRLGLRSGREGDKLGGLELRTGVTGCPLLADAIAGLECRVVNAMDAGAATFFLGEVVAATPGTEGPVMTSEYFRSHMPPERQTQYEANLARAQEALEGLAQRVDPTRTWTGPTSPP